jgi:hypothetical protein
MITDLRSFLRRAPKPASLRIRTEDGDEKEIKLGPGRFRWHACEETVRSCGAVSVQCLDSAGNVLRAGPLEGGAEDDDEPRGKTPAEDKASAKTMIAQAAMLDAYGKRLAEAFAAGSDAASQSQDKLVALVESLTAHLTLAITNLHNVSTNYANVLSQQTGQDGGAANPLIGQFLGAVMGGQMQVAPHDANGKKK